MNGLELSTFFFLVLVSAWLLTGIILLLHRYSITLGLFPLTVIIGGLTAVMQLQILGIFTPEIGERIIRLLVGNYILLPVILTSLLIIYVANGSIQARVIVDGVIAIALLAAILGFAKLYFPYGENLPVFTIIEISPRFLLAQVLSLAIAIMALFGCYQAISNMRARFSSRLAGGVALLFAVLTHTLSFYGIAYAGVGGWQQDFGLHLATKSLLVLALWPLVIPYLFRVAPRLPNSVATLQRPALDFFMTVEQLESSAQYNHSLLRTFSKINQLIVHSTEAELLLQKACEALVELRKYHMVWIGTLDEQSGEVHFVAQSGFSPEQVEKYTKSNDMGQLHTGRIMGQAVVMNNIASQKGSSDLWQRMMLSSGCRAAATLPMNYAGRVMGFLNVCLAKPNSLEEIETELLQDLANDLAYALVSLESRRQRAILHTATETMQDGLLIADLNGIILYANAIIAQIVGIEPEAMLGKNIDDLLKPDQLEILTDTFQRLYQDKVLIFDLPYQTFGGSVAEISVNAALVEDQHGIPVQLVANIRDISHLRDYERQLLTLNHLTGELVQIRDTQVLMKRILEMSEDLMDAKSSGIYFVDATTRKITNTLTNNLALAYSQRIAKDYHGLPGETAGKTLRPVFITDTLNDPIYGERIHFMAEHDIRALLILPIVFQDQPIGALTVYYPQPKNFSESQLQLGLTLAQTLAIVIQNARLYQQFQEHATELETRVQKRTYELLSATEYIGGILASVPDAVFVLDQENHLLHANQAGEYLLAQAQTDGLDLFNPKLLQILKKGTGPDIQSILEVKERAYQAHSSQLVADDALINGQIIVFRDVTQFRELDQMKNQFVSDVSHELRTPLTNLTLYLGLLSTVRDPIKQNEYTQTLQRETDRLTHLIEDLLTISRLEASRIQFQIRAIDINKLVEQLVKDRAILAAYKSIDLDFFPTDDLPPASVDENMLTQALSNLLTNATNYTQPGGSVRVSTSIPEPDWITIQISDTGVGISGDETDQIFDRFYRGSASRLTGAEGTGLGLSISKEIVQRLGGKITIQTTPGEGSTFTIWLKPARDDLTQPQP